MAKGSITNVLGLTPIFVSVDEFEIDILPVTILIYEAMRDQEIVDDVMFDAFIRQCALLVRDMLLDQCQHCLSPKQLFKLETSITVHLIRSLCQNKPANA